MLLALRTIVEPVDAAAVLAPGGTVSESAVSDAPCNCVMVPAFVLLAVDVFGYVRTSSTVLLGGAVKITRLGVEASSAASANRGGLTGTSASTGSSI